MKTLLTLVCAIFLYHILLAQENGGPYTTDKNTVLLMHFDGNATNTATVGNNGIIHGSGVSFEPGVHGNSLRLDNSSNDKQSWIEVPFYNELNFTEEFSIECWFKINSWGENHTKFPFILRKGGSGQSDYEILLNREFASLTANLNCVDDEYNRGANVRTTDIIKSGKWYHLAVYFNFSHKHLYLVLRDENFKELYANHKYAYTQAFNSSDKLLIGFATNNDTYFDGWIDELRISNKYLKHRDDIVSNINIAELKDSVQPLLRDKWKVYQWPFMAYFPRNTETGELHKGNSCGMTASMRLIHYWENPRFPSGKIDFVDQNYHWLADFENTEYRFDEMPYSFGPNPTEEEYSAAATMVAHVGAAEIKYGLGGGGAPIKTILEKYFKFNKELKIVYREEYTKTEWENIFKNELSNGRPILIEGTAERYEDGNWAGHFYVCDGYSADNKFHTDLSIGEIEWWTDIDNFEYGKNQCALIYAKPDWQGKTLSLDYPKGDEYFQKQSEIELNWSSTKISKVLLEYSVDAGKNWKIIAENVDASIEKYKWMVPDLVSKEYKIRISDSENGNIYRRCKTFNVFNQKNISFSYPAKNTYFQALTAQPIYWDSEGIPAFKLEYLSGDNNWNLLCDSVLATSGFFNCIIPDLNEDNVILRATDLTNNNLYFLSDTFSIKPEKLIGGVSNMDNETILLMHFEENIVNSANNNLFPNESITGFYTENYGLNLGRSYRIDNSQESNNCKNIWINNSENIDIENNWTLEGWVKIKSTGDYKTGYFPIIIEKAESFGIFIYQDYVGNELNGFNSYINFNNGSKVEFFQRQKLSLNKWYHIAMISDSGSGTVNFFVHDENRNLIYEDSKSFPSGSDGKIKQNNNRINIGGWSANSNRQFDGWMDELRITKKSQLYNYLELTELPFTDNFEETISNDAIFSKWTTENLEGWNYWHIIPWNGNPGQCMRFGNTDINQNDWLITKPINTKNTYQLEVSFNYFYFGGNAKPKLMYKKLNDDGNNSDWIELAYTLGPNKNQWYKSDKIIIENTGDAAYFAFHYESTPENAMYFLLDNFSVTAVAQPVLATIQTNPAGSISYNSAKINGSISSNGGQEITKRGFYWSSSNTEPNSGDQVKLLSGSSNNLSFVLENLTPETTYYFRAFATNSIGTALGEVKQFTTLKAIQSPVILTIEATNIDHEIAVINGKIISDGGAAITECGFYWSDTNSNPDAKNGFVDFAENTATFSVELKKLTPGKVYYYRSFAKNSAGTALGEVKQFTTINTASEIKSISLNEFKISPNPITGNSVISFQINSIENVDISVYDVQGRKIYTILNKSLNPGLYTIPVNNSIEVNGIYLCKLSTPKGVSTLKLVVNR